MLQGASVINTINKIFFGETKDIHCHLAADEFYTCILANTSSFLNCSNTFIFRSIFHERSCYPIHLRKVLYAPLNLTRRTYHLLSQGQYIIFSVCRRWEMHPWLYVSSKLVADRKVLYSLIHDVILGSFSFSPSCKICYKFNSKEPVERIKEGNKNIENIQDYFRWTDWS